MMITTHNNGYDFRKQKSTNVIFNLENDVYTLSEVEYQVISAIFHGNFENKEIYDYLSQNRFIKLSTVQYTMKKLLSKFRVTTRSMLFRRLIECNYGTIIMHEKNKQQHF